MSNKIKLVTTKTDSTPDSTLYIIPGDNPDIRYKSGNQEVIISLDKKDRPLYCSELVNMFRDCNWFISKRPIIVDNEGDDFSIYLLSDNRRENTPIYEFIQSSSKIPTDTILDEENWWEEFWEDIKDSIKSDGEISESIKDSILEEIESRKMKIETMAKTNEIYLFDNSTNKIDFLNNHNIIRLVEYNSDVYTDTVDIKKVLSGISCKSGITSSKIDLSIQYTKKKGNSISILNHNTTFEGFSVSGKNIEITNFIETVGDDVDIEYLNGVIKLYPKTNNIIECIISNCIISYGKLNK